MRIRDNLNYQLCFITTHDDNTFSLIFPLLPTHEQVTSPEDFALLLTSHFLEKYPQVIATNVKVREYPWQRQVVDGRAHNHSFIFCPEVEHTCQVSRKRGGE